MCRLRRPSQRYEDRCTGEDCSANQELDVMENTFMGRLNAQEDCTLFLLPAIYYCLPALRTQLVC